MNTIRLPFLHLLLAAALLALSLGASAENFTRRDVTFRSEGLNLSAWYYVPKGMKPDEKRPAIVMAHGFSAPKEALLANFADRFAAAGFVVTVFDFRFLGASEGEPRGQIFPLQQIDDYRNAITWTQLQKEVDPGRMYQIKGELDSSGIYADADIEDFSEIYFKPKLKQSPADHQKMNAIIDRPVSSFADIVKSDPAEAEVLRGKILAFCSLYGFLSQIIPYQDSDLERLYVFLRHLAAKLPKKGGSPSYQFDDEVRLDYYRLQKVSEGSISLSEGTAKQLDGPSSVGSKIAREEQVPLSRLIDVVNERFGTDFNNADQLFFDQIVEAALADASLRQAAIANPGEKFELLFKNLLEALFVERMDQNEEIFARYMNDKAFQGLVTNWLSTEAYAKLRSRLG